MKAKPCHELEKLKSLSVYSCAASTTIFISYTLKDANTHVHRLHAQKKATSFNTSISSEREAAWSHKSGSYVCVQTKWIAAGWNCATVWLRIGASMACGGTSGAKLGYRWHGSILTTTSVSKHWGMERDPGIRCTSAVLLQQFLVRLTGRNHFHTVSWSFFFTY